MSEPRETCVPEWIQMEIDEREAEARAARRWDLARLALYAVGLMVALRALSALAQ